MLALLAAAAPLLLLLHLAPAPVLSSSSNFFTNPARYQRELWHIGDIETIEWQSEFEEYTIALWQQSLSMGAANMGPILYQTTKKSSKMSFDWPVQVYDLDLDESNVFFLWMFEGDAKMQGDQTATQMSSSYFNITSDPRSSSSVVSTEPTTTAISSTAASTAASTVESTAASTVESTPVSTSATKEADAPDAAASTSPVDTASQASQDLPVAAKAGIGVGVGIGGLACIVCTFLLWRYLRNKKNGGPMAELEGTPPPADSASAWKPLPFDPAAHQYNEHYAPLSPTANRAELNGLTPSELNG